MKIELKEFTVGEVAAGYKNTLEEGVVGFGGRLNIRPKYQREFVYNEEKRNAVIGTIRKNFPLNVMYWVKNADGSYEVLDGQQRTISFCEYVAGTFSVDCLYFHNLTDTEREQILSYPLMIYVCEGTDREKLDWFRIINIAGEKLTDQELRNAVYTGEWLTDAKRYFSRTNCVAYALANGYMSGSCIRQDYLESVLSWISDGKIEEYMAQRQHDGNAAALWLYFSSVIEWVKAVFPVYRKEMKGLGWGRYYNRFKDGYFDAKALEKRTEELMADEDVTAKKGIYEYLLDGDERHLNIRAFTPKMKREAYEKQKGICPLCKKAFALEEMEGDHITPWRLGGATVAENCQMLCRACNRKKSGK